MKPSIRHASLLLASLLLPFASSAQSAPRVVHVFVALADNVHQGIVPVPKALGNGDDAGRNLYWGAAFGVKTFLGTSKDWKLLRSVAPGKKSILETAVFYHAKTDTLLVADAYRGSEIKEAIADFFAAAAGHEKPIAIEFELASKTTKVAAPASLAVYVGHDGLMDFSLEKTFADAKGAKRQAIVLACASKQYFAGPLKQTGASPLLWTTNLMAPEAYTLKAALDGWIAGETDEQIRERSAAAYAQYQKISKGAALKLFATGW